MSERSRTLAPRIEGAGVTRSVCPCRGVGCARLIHTREGINIKRDPDSPISRECLCPVLPPASGPACER
jgi:hypothetical protein